MKNPVQYMSTSNAHKEVTQTSLEIKTKNHKPRANKQTGRRVVRKEGRLGLHVILQVGFIITSN